MYMSVSDYELKSNLKFPIIMLYMWVVLWFQFSDKYFWQVEKNPFFAC